MTENDMSVALDESYTGDPKLQESGRQLAIDLATSLGMATAMAVISNAWGEIASAVLHMPSPMPEQNVKSLRDLIESMTDLVNRHEKCALKNVPEQFRAVGKKAN